MSPYVLSQGIIQLSPKKDFPKELQRYSKTKIFLLNLCKSLFTCLCPGGRVLFLLLYPGHCSHVALYT